MTVFDGQTEIKPSECSTVFNGQMTSSWCWKKGRATDNGQKTINRLFGGWFSNPDTANNRLILLARDVSLHMFGVNMVCVQKDRIVWHDAHSRRDSNEFICGWWRAQSHACLMQKCINGFCFSTSIAASDIYHGIQHTCIVAAAAVAHRHHQH